MLLQRRLIFVTGKGGVGKSTVALALGLLAARQGRRTIVGELASQERAQHAFEHQGERFRELELAPGLFTISIDPEHAMDEYLRLKAGALGHTLGSTRLFQAFAMATPGMRELLSIGKVWELAQLERQTRQSAYDLVIVDSPATGHGAALLRTPRTFSEIARVGPIARQASRIAETIADRAFTAVLAVSIAEEMPVNETLSLRDMLDADGLELDVVILNGLYPERFAAAEVGPLRDALVHADSPLARSAIRAALSEHARAGAQRDERDRLAAELDSPPIELPYVFAEQLGIEELTALSYRLEDALSTVGAVGATLD